MRRLHPPRALVLRPSRSRLPAPPALTTRPVRGHICQATPASNPSPSSNAQQDEAKVDLRQLERTLQEQRTRLEALVKEENYRAAQQVSRLVQELENAHPLLKLQKQLQQAVAEERYEDAAKLRAELLAVQEQHLAAGACEGAALSSRSEALTHGIQVTVRSFYLPMHSSPTQQRFLFGYHITIQNQSDRVVQLRTRHWVITDADGKREEVRGPGVVGNQPVLLPGKSYEYQSGCPLRTSWGTMEGSYQFVVLDETDGRFKDTMDVRVAKFKLTSEGEMGA